MSIEPLAPIIECSDAKPLVGSGIRQLNGARLSDRHRWINLVERSQGPKYSPDLGSMVASHRHRNRFAQYHMYLQAPQGLGTLALYP